MITQLLKAYHTHAFNVQRIDINDFLCVDVMLDRPYSLAFPRSDRAVSLIKQPSLWIASRPWFLRRNFVVLICNCVVHIFRGVEGQVRINQHKCSKLAVFGGKKKTKREVYCCLSTIKNEKKRKGKSCSFQTLIRNDLNSKSCILNLINNS